MSLALNKEMSFLDPSMANSDDKLKLQESAGKFLKIYTQQHCAIYADLQYEIAETKMPPKFEM